ncbi:MAG: hypothetical protein H0T79_15225, partial [Deltaproteobacteria bacterium]|nr:hypothetical protein [Deltaproteobacteria bacterium]
MRSRRAWIYVLSIAALLVPAGGIAYLGVASYRDERGAVTAQNERQRQAALGVAARIDRAISEGLDTVEREADLEHPNWHAGVSSPLARYWFWIEPDGKVRVPRGAPEIAAFGGSDRAAPCSGGLEDCVRELST